MISEADGSLIWMHEEPIVQYPFLAPLIAAEDGWVYLFADDGSYAFATPPDVNLAKKVDKTAAVAGDTLRGTRFPGAMRAR